MPENSNPATVAGRIGTAISITLSVVGVASSAAVVGLMFFLVVARYVLGLSVWACTS